MGFFDEGVALLYLTSMISAFHSRQSSKPGIAGMFHASSSKSDIVTSDNTTPKAHRWRELAV
jgi:hypothetical protein